MNKSMKSFLAYMVFSMLFFGCKKSEPILFDEKAAITFNYFQVSDSKQMFSFLGKSEAVGTVKIPVIINGFPEDRDRRFEVEVVTDTITDAKPSDYQIETGIIHAGNVKDTLILKVNKTTELNDKVLNLYLRVKPNDEFSRGIAERQYYQVAWSNQAIMPTWGTYFRTFFSTAGSTRAYRIFVETTGLTNFTATEYRLFGQAGAEVLGRKFGDYIRAWNAAHPEDRLLHDDGASKGLAIVPKY